MNTLRSVVPTDRELIFNWRNLPEVAKYMYTDHVIGWEEHCLWFEKAMRDPTRHYWIIVCEEQDVGLVNLYNIDLENRRCFWAFYIASANTRGKGVGSFVEYAILNFVFEVMNLNKLCCEVFAFNEAVVGMHKSFGFSQEAFYREHIFKNGEPFDVIGLAMLWINWNSMKQEIGNKLRQKGIV